jgi:hypothetical protein
MHLKTRSATETSVTRQMAIIGLAAVLAGSSIFHGKFANARPTGKTSQFAVGAQYGTTHVYVAEQDMDRFTASFLATFGGKSTPQSIVTVTPRQAGPTGRPSSRRWG